MIQSERRLPWQTLEIDLNHPKTAREAIEIAGLDYTVVKKRVEAKTGSGQDSYATVRTDTGDVLGIVGDGYEPVQNRDAFRFFDTLVGTDEAIYETAGILGRGELNLVWSRRAIKVEGVSSWSILSPDQHRHCLVFVSLSSGSLKAKSTSSPPKGLTTFSPFGLM